MSISQNISTKNTQTTKNMTYYFHLSDRKFSPYLPSKCRTDQPTSLRLLAQWNRKIALDCQKQATTSSKVIFTAHLKTPYRIGVRKIPHPHALSKLEKKKSKKKCILAACNLKGYIIQNGSVLILNPESIPARSNFLQKVDRTVQDVHTTLSAYLLQYTPPIHIRQSSTIICPCSLTNLSKMSIFVSICNIDN